MDTYYERSPTVFVDGSPIFKSKEDELNEASVSDLISTAWKCQCGSFGKLAPIDWFFVRDGRLVGVGELKSRTHQSIKYGTVFLNVRKWLALSLASTGLGVPAVFCVKFTDTCLWVKVNDINATLVTIGGCNRIVKSRNDIEPVIEIPISSMKPINENKSLPALETEIICYTSK